MSDRGMKKWAPYKTLQEQWSTLDDMHKNEELVEKPKLSNERAEEINEILVNYHGQELEIYYYKKGRILKEKNTIKSIDVLNRRLILDNNIIIYLKDLVELK